eukprot:GHUV01015207.1.p2 GENE.GHUV01015207.1~~GHUV01015207.1.p2  ORF type:complete len:132 (-),score=31.65 GHUV01015207.1:269-664(-)
MDKGDSAAATTAVALGSLNLLQHIIDSMRYLRQGKTMDSGVSAGATTAPSLGCPLELQQWKSTHSTGTVGPAAAATAQSQGDLPEPLLCMYAHPMGRAGAADAATAIHLTDLPLLLWCMSECRSCMVAAAV